MAASNIQLLQKAISVTFAWEAEVSACYNYAIISNVKILQDNNQDIFGGFFDRWGYFLSKSHGYEEVKMCANIKM